MSRDPRRPLFHRTETRNKSPMFALMGLGILLLVVGLAILIVPGIGIMGIPVAIVGVLLIVSSFAARRRTTPQPRA